MNSITIGDSQKDFGEEIRTALYSAFPQTVGHAFQVEIFENDRKKRRDASRESWNPARGEIRIKFVGVEAEASHLKSSRTPIADDDGDPRGPQPGPLESSNLEIGAQDNRRANLIKSLDAAEKRPGFSFVALKWFRDLCLPAEGYGWASSSSSRDEVIRLAINDGVILTSKVPNPKAPAFPVTAIRLNRSHPDVAAALGEKGSESIDFEPVGMRGEALSSTVLSDRR